MQQAVVWRGFVCCVEEDDGLLGGTGLGEADESFRRQERGLTRVGGCIKGRR